MERKSKLDLDQVALLARAGWSGRDIAKRLGTSHQLVNYHLRRRIVEICCPHCDRPLPPRFLAHFRQIRRRARTHSAFAP